LCLAVLTLLIPGCTVTVERVGSPALVDEIPWQGDGVTRAESVIQTLGVPDEIGDEDTGFRFVYRFIRRNESSFQIGGYGFKLVTDERLRVRDGSLDLLFDEDARLLEVRSNNPGTPGLREDDR